MQKWKKNRFDIMRSLDLGMNARQIGEQLGISDKAVYKNIQDSGMEDIGLLFRYIGEQVQKTVAFPRYRVFMYNTANTTASVFLYAYRNRCGG